MQTAQLIITQPVRTSLKYMKNQRDAEKLIIGISSEGKNYKMVFDILDANFGNKEMIKNHLHGSLRKLLAKNIQHKMRG